MGKIEIAKVNEDASRTIKPLAVGFDLIFKLI
jgi:hypothetical protein